MTSKKNLSSALTAATLNNLNVIQQEIVAPQELLTPKIVETLAEQGLSRPVIAGLYRCAVGTIYNTPELDEAFLKGRGTIAKKLRTQLVEDALYNDSMPAKLYLDKIMGGDVEQKSLAVTVTQTPLENVSTEKLLEIDDGQDTDD